MTVAELDNSVQDRVGALRERIAASRQVASSMFDGLRQPASLPPGIDDVIANIRGKIALTGDDDSMNASPNPGLPMMAGTTNKQK